MLGMTRKVASFVQKRRCPPGTSLDITELNIYNQPTPTVLGFLEFSKAPRVGKFKKWNRQTLASQDVGQGECRFLGLSNDAVTEKR